MFQFVQIGRIAFLKLAVREACSFARLLPAWTRSSLYRSPTRAGIHAKIPAELLPLIKLPPVIVELVLFELGGELRIDFRRTQDGKVMSQLDAGRFDVLLECAEAGFSHG